MRKIIKRLISVLMCLVMVLCMLPVFEASVHAETGYDRGFDGGMAGDGVIYAHGLDVSAWNSTGLDFQNFANAGYDYVILRIGTSYGMDNCFEEYYASAKAAGLDVGCYYYSYATSTAEAQAEAYDVLSWMNGKLFEYPIYYDYEDPSQSSIDGTVASQICYAFMDTLKANGYLVGLYSMASWLEQSWVTTSGIRDTYEGWVAHILNEEANTGITSDVYEYYHSTYSTRYGMYQYSWDTYVNGVGPFDADVCYKDYPTIVQTYGFNGYQQISNLLDGYEPVDLGANFYAYVRQTASGKYLTNSNGNVCVTDSLVDNGTQRWHFIRQANGAYSLGIDGTSLWMDVADSNYANGTNIQMLAGDGSYDQKFYVYYIGGNFYFRAMYNEKTVDVDAATGNVQLYGSSTGIESYDTYPSAWEARSFEILKTTPDNFQWQACIGWYFSSYIRNTATGKLLTADGDNAVFADPTYEESQRWIVTRNDYGAHTIVSALTGKALDVYGQSIEPGTTINLVDPNGQKNQDFFVIHAGSSNYYIKPSYTNTVVSMDASTGKLLSQTYGTATEQQNAQTFEFVTDHHIDADVEMRYAQHLGDTFRAQIIARNNTVLTDNAYSVSMVANTYAENQYWTFTYDSATNAYKITGSSGKVLDVYQSGWSDGTGLRVAESGDALSQCFRFYSVDYGYIISPAHTQQILGISDTNQMVIQLQSPSPATENCFYVSIASHSGKTPVDLGETFTSSIQNVASGLYVTATEEGAANCTATSSQWKFTRQASGGYTIEDASTGEVLDIASGKITGGTNVQLYPANGTIAQTFFIYETDGGYVFMCAGSPNVIDMDASTTELHIYPWKTTESGIAAQTFSLPEAAATATKLILKTGSSLSEEETYVTNVSVDTTAAWLAGQFKNDGVVVYDGNGNEVADDAVCATGYSVNLVKNGEVIDTLEIVVAGDVDGNGEIDTTDYLRIKSMFLGTYTLEGAYFLAGDVDQNGIIDTTDYMRIRAHFLGTQDLYALC